MSNNRLALNRKQKNLLLEKVLTTAKRNKPTHTSCLPVPACCFSICYNDCFFTSAHSRIYFLCSFEFMNVNNFLYLLAIILRNLLINHWKQLLKSFISIQCEIALRSVSNDAFQRAKLFRSRRNSCQFPLLTETLICLQSRSTFCVSATIWISFQLRMQITKHSPLNLTKRSIQRPDNAVNLKNSP